MYDKLEELLTLSNSCKYQTIPTYSMDQAIQKTDLVDFITKNDASNIDNTLAFKFSI